jgi:hypothetical protein
LEAEVAAYIDAHAHEQGRRLVVRNLLWALPKSATRWATNQPVNNAA